VIRLRGGEVRERPDVSADDEVPVGCHAQEALDKFGLVLLGPHGRRVRVNAGNGVRPELGHHYGLAIAIVHAVEPGGEHRLGDVELGQVGPEAVTYGAATLPMEDFLNGASRPPLRNRRASVGLQS
jgi:hypothetical protein